MNIACKECSILESWVDDATLLCIKVECFENAGLMFEKEAAKETLIFFFFFFFLHLLLRNSGMLTLIN